jgi:gas vesicle protein
VRAEVVELVFAGAVVVVFASAAAVVLDRISRSWLLRLSVFLSAAAVVVWVAFALKPERAVAVAAGGLTVCAGFELALLALRRLLVHGRDIDRQLATAEERLDAVVRKEIDTRASELERTLTLARAESLSRLTEEERRVAEQRRGALHEREQRASAELSETLAKVEQRIGLRLGEWRSDLERTEQALTAQLEGLGQRQEQLISEAASRIAVETEHLESVGEEQRERLAALAAEFERVVREIAERAQSELEQHESDRRRALHEVAERLRERERELRERIGTEEAEAVHRIQAGLADVERRQVDQLKRIVERTASSFSDQLQKQFSDEVRRAREDAAQRLSRELDRAVENFAREAQSVLAERLAHVADAGGQRLERKLSQIGSSLEHEQHELVAELQRRIGDAEVELRSHVQALAADAEAERTVMNARLNELRKRIEELVGEAESRLAPTFRTR